VDSAEAWLIVDELLARGWWKAEIARRVTGPDALSLQMGDRQVFAGTLRILRGLQLEPVPKRYHSPTGQWLTPKRDHKPRLIDPTTPGVPISPDLAALVRALWLQDMRRGLAEALAIAQERDSVRALSLPVR
jgi:hypothetical protein